MTGNSMTCDSVTGDSVTLTAVQAEAVRWLGAYMDSGRQRTDHLRKAAEAVARLRGFFWLRDGVTDWGGRSTAYRALIREVYVGAGIGMDIRDSVQSAMRYHVGNYLRENVPAHDLALCGFGEESPKERTRRHRDVVAALATSGSVAEVTGDPVRLVQMTDVLLAAAGDAGLASLTEAQAEQARAILASIQGKVEVLAALVADDPVPVGG